VTDINNDRAFDRNDQDPELIGQAIVEAMQQMARHFEKIAVAGEMVKEASERNPGEGKKHMLDDLDEVMDALLGTDLDRAEKALTQLGASCVNGVVALRAARKRRGE
jgi:hypothetical protein